MEYIDRDILNLVWATDENYVFLTGVSMTSVLMNNKDIEIIQIWILSDCLCEESKQLLRECASEYGRETFFIDVNEKLKELIEIGVGAWGPKGSYSAYSRLFLECFLREYDVKRAIYCDCDLIINGSLRTIMDWDLQDKTIGLCMDYNRVEIRRILNLPKSAKYFNTGFMLIDLQRWRDRKCTERIVEHMKSVRASYPFVDQDLINCVLHEEIAILPIEYNVNPRVMVYNYGQLCTAYGMNPENYYGKKEYDRVHKGEPIVYHCSDPAAGRPWEEGNRHIYSDVWNKYFEKSMWSAIYKKKTYIPNLSSKWQNILSKILPKCIYVYMLQYGAKTGMKKLIKMFE